MNLALIFGKRISVLQLKRELRLESYQSAWRMLHQICKVMEKEEYKKETFEFIVVVDEIYEGGIVRLGLTAEEAKLAPQLYF